MRSVILRREMPPNSSSRLPVRGTLSVTSQTCLLCIRATLTSESSSSWRGYTSQNNTYAMLSRRSFQRNRSAKKGPHLQRQRWLPPWLYALFRLRGCGTAPIIHFFRERGGGACGVRAALKIWGAPIFKKGCNITLSPLPYILPGATPRRPRGWGCDVP